MVKKDLVQEVIDFYNNEFNIRERVASSIEFVDRDGVYLNQERKRIKEKASCPYHKVEVSLVTKRCYVNSGEEEYSFTVGFDQL